MLSEHCRVRSNEALANVFVVVVVFFFFFLELKKKKKNIYIYIFKKNLASPTVRSFRDIFLVFTGSS